VIHNRLVHRPVPAVDLDAAAAREQHLAVHVGVGLAGPLVLAAVRVVARRDEVVRDRMAHVLVRRAVGVREVVVVPADLAERPVERRRRQVLEEALARELAVELFQQRARLLFGLALLLDVAHELDELVLELGVAFFGAVQERAAQEERRSASASTAEECC
jgi:hypothetical protein